MELGGEKKNRRPDQISIFQNSPNIFTSYEVEVNSDFKMADMNSASGTCVQVGSRVGSASFADWNATLSGCI